MTISRSLHQKKEEFLQQTSHLQAIAPEVALNLTEEAHHPYLANPQYALAQLNCSRLSTLSRLTASLPHPNCRVSVVVPVRNEEKDIPLTIESLALQTDGVGLPLDPSVYEILILANNCSDKTVSIAEAMRDRYPFLQLHIIDLVLPPEDAFIGKVRQMVMDEAYRRFSLVGLNNRIIASTDGDTSVANNWIAALIDEFDRGADAVGGRILTRRANQTEISSQVSLRYLRRVAHAYLSAQIDCLLNPQPHDRWPRHFQFCGANMAVSAKMYAHINGIPLVRDEEDVALYRRLQRADAKVRHSLNVRVETSARSCGRATGGLSELLSAFSNMGERSPALVESPSITVARAVVLRYLRQIWATLRTDLQETSFEGSFKIQDYANVASLLSKSLGVPAFKLRSQIENAHTFGELIAALSSQQLRYIEPSLFEADTEISAANMLLRQRLRHIREQNVAPKERCDYAQFQPHSSIRIVLETLQQVQAIPLFPPAYD